MKRQIAAIEFGTSKIVTTIAENSGIDRLDIIGSGTVPYDGYSDGDWNTPQQMAQRVRDSIAAAEMDAGCKVREIYVGVPGDYINVYSCEAEVDSVNGEITPEVVTGVMDAAAQKLRLTESNMLVLHRTPAWYIIDDGKKTMSPNGSGDRLRAKVTFIVADPMFVQDIGEMMEVLDLTILGFLAPTLGQSLLLIPFEDRDRTSLLIDCGYLNTEISVVEGDAIVYHAVLPRGGGHITADLATELRIPMRAAEKIKREFAFSPDEYEIDSFSEVFDHAGHRLTFSREVISQIVEESVDELMEMIDMTIEEDAKPFMTDLSQVFLTGGGISLMNGGREYLSDRIRRPVNVAAAKTSKMNSPVFSAALGLADLIFDSLDQQEAEAPKGVSKFKKFFKGRNA